MMTLRSLARRLRQDPAHRLWFAGAYLSEFVRNPTKVRMELPFLPQERSVNRNLPENRKLSSGNR
ncbi:protein of unknown function [Methylorubrum extorquens DM4]|uniref:Uncharacterized protein n=1 Tax=Methylorubrum extorquens (strain DSM 6343 / CIP 106787 / DM4) TaxID=661410 RepID=C7CGL8_METED|nr:protein of unknown function [Methylorubrum extorquens DM4]